MFCHPERMARWQRIMYIIRPSVYRQYHLSPCSSGTAPGEGSYITIYNNMKDSLKTSKNYSKSCLLFQHKYEFFIKKCCQTDKNILLYIIRKYSIYGYTKCHSERSEES